MRARTSATLLPAGSQMPLYPRLPSPQGPCLAQLRRNSPSSAGNAGPSCFSAGSPPPGHPRNVSPGCSGAGREPAFAAPVSGLGTPVLSVGTGGGQVIKEGWATYQSWRDPYTPVHPQGIVGVQTDLCQALGPAQAYMWDCDLDSCKGDHCGVPGSPTCPPDASRNSTNMILTPRPFPGCNPSASADMDQRPANPSPAPQLQEGGCDLSPCRMGPCSESGSPFQLPGAPGDNDNMILPSRPFCL